MRRFGHPPAPRRPVTGLTAVFAAFLVTAVTACGSSGNSSGGSSSDGSGSATSTSLGFGSPAAQLPATPPDVPAAAPACTGSLNQRAYVRPDLVHLISGCSNQQETELQITNLSGLVLDVAPAADTSAQLQVTSYDTSSGLLPTPADELEVEAQNTVLGPWSPDNSAAVFLPVGATLTATASEPPVELSVNVDPGASWFTFGATIMTGYVVGNVTDATPAEFYQSIADCVNATYRFWLDLEQAQPTPSPADLINQVLGLGKCAALAGKVNAYLDRQSHPADPLAEADRGGLHVEDGEFVSQYEQEEQVQDEIRSDIR
jgi:hypothetical protein